ncbi:hypothetical protein Aab01nite_34510 [Paractinoplanes abujensis]|uniref:ABC-type glycerol-3-phosphate transport system substrate-binding protein n=1 Tax=Paractinoplanes abujensis TaxID=882441 RepID=A0A7W7CZP4_9ACTN|nr:lamin tail domain-containing protein [Actinoplanes abujensis]MBB4697650.1 ABC-type glycerol-3-phosphate transport system substrate-binding protein [Actinoplanes abujensis]GID19861.1 hypothetical protein Aab01nite_34510 [Actinoplanes abujensis]
MRKLLAPLAVAAAVFGFGAAPASAATKPVLFTYVYVDSPGTDNRTNASLNQEYFRLTNQLAKPVGLKNWSVRDAAGKVITFGNITLPAKGTFVVHTGKGTQGSPAGHFYWNSGNYIWNNTGDTATLRSPSGATMDTCTWKKVSTTKC